MKLYKILVLLHISTSFWVFSQNDPKLSLFYYTPLTYNPAYAGSYQGLDVTSIYSSQWVGFEGAPKTLFLSAHGVLDLPNTALGVDVISDKIGPVLENKVAGNFAYQINLNEKWQLALGFKAGINNFKIDYTLLIIDNPFETGLADNQVTQNSLIIGSGAFLYSENTFLGISVPNMLTTRYYNDYKNQMANKRPYYFISGGYKFNLENEIYMQPNFISRITEGAPISTLVALSINWKEKLMGSINFETKVSMGGFVGFRFIKNFMIGYSYDISLNNFSKNNDGIHTVLINYRLKNIWGIKQCSCYTL